MNEELLAILKRVREHNEAIKTDATFAFSPYWIFDLPTQNKAWNVAWLSEDEGILARAYLAEHLADDDEPLSEAWLREIGADGDWVCLCLGNYDHMQLCISFSGMTKGDGQKRAWLRKKELIRNTLQIEILGIDFPETRGQIRHLLSALGIKTK